MLVEAYDEGRNEALRDPGLSDDDLPASSQWAVEQIMDDNLLPDYATTGR